MPYLWGLQLPPSTIQRYVQYNLYDLYIIFSFLPHKWAGCDIFAIAFQVLSRNFIAAMRKKRPGLLNDYLLHQDNAPSHKSAYTQAMMDKLNMKTVDHPPYSPDLAPNDFYLFPTLKAELRGRRMGSIEEIQNTVCSVFKSIPKDSFRRSFLTWVHRWEKCLRYKGEYFEKM